MKTGKSSFAKRASGDETNEKTHTQRLAVSHKAQTTSFITHIMMTMLTLTMIFSGISKSRGKAKKFLSSNFNFSEIFGINYCNRRSTVSGQVLA